MSTTILQRRKFLFVDDDASFLEMIQRVMAAYSQDGWDIFTAQNTGRALGVLQEHAINMVVIDVQMPVVDGLQFLTLLNRKYPNLQKVVLTGFANENYRAACLSSGAEMFLEKPKTMDGFESLYATLNELTKWQPEEGFRGVLRRVGLQDVIQMECLSRNSSILEIKARKSTGQIFIRDGSIIHAVYGERKGEDAFNVLLSLKGGEFKLRTFTEPPEQTIEGSWEFLLMEAARMRDELAEQESSTDTIPAPQPAPAPAVPPERPSAAASIPPQDSDPFDIGQIFRRAPQSSEAPKVTAAPELQASLSGAAVPVEPLENPVAPPEDLDQPQEAPPVPMLEASDIPPNQIEEVLLCSAHGDVLYEWKCRNSDVWINFLEFVSQKSRQLGQGLALGKFERVEIDMESSRMVARIDSTGGVLVRSSVESPAPQAPGPA